MAKQRTGSIRYVHETSSENSRATEEFIKQAVMNALARVRNANLGVAFFDGDEDRTTTIVFEKFTTPPSEEMRQAMEYEFGPVEEPPAVTA
jgi:hypothetical protein